MSKVLAMFVAASVAGLLAQINESLWQQGAWGLMCAAFLTGLTFAGKWIQNLIKEARDLSQAEIERLRKELEEVRKSIKHD